MKLTKSQLEQIIKEAIVEEGGMSRNWAHKREVARLEKAANPPNLSPEEIAKEEKEIAKEEKERLARLAKLGHLYPPPKPPSDVKESQDDEPITSEAAVREPTHEGTCASAHPNVLSHEEWAKAKETPSGRLHKEGAMKLTKSRLKQIIGEEVATVLLERERKPSVWEDEDGQWWVVYPHSNKKKEISYGEAQRLSSRGVEEGIEAEPMAPSGVNQQAILKDVIAVLQKRDSVANMELKAFLDTLLKPKKTPEQRMSPSVQRSSEIPLPPVVQRENNMKLTKSKLKQIIEEEISEGYESAGDLFPGAEDIDD